MPEAATYAMVRAAMIKAVETNLIPRHSRLADYIKSWERLEIVIQAALDVYPEKKLLQAKKQESYPRPKQVTEQKNASNLRP